MSENELSYRTTEVVIDHPELDERIRCGRLKSVSIGFRTEGDGDDAE